LWLNIFFRLVKHLCINYFTTQRDIICLDVSHTDQYRNFCSSHPIEHKLSAVRTLLERSQSLVSDSHDRQLEDAHIEKALQSCGYPELTFRKVRSDDDENKKEETEKRPRRLAPYHTALCERHIGKGGLSKETSGACHSETSQNFEKATGASEG